MIAPAIRLTPLLSLALLAACQPAGRQPAAADGANPAPPPAAAAPPAPADGKPSGGKPANGKPLDEWNRELIGMAASMSKMRLHCKQATQAEFEQARNEVVAKLVAEGFASAEVERAYAQADAEVAANIGKASPQQLKQSCQEMEEMNKALQSAVKEMHSAIEKQGAAKKAKGQ